MKLLSEKNIYILLPCVSHQLRFVYVCSLIHSSLCQSGKDGGRDIRQFMILGASRL